MADGMLAHAGQVSETAESGIVASRHSFIGTVACSSQVLLYPCTYTLGRRPDTLAHETPKTCKENQGLECDPINARIGMGRKMICCFKLLSLEKNYPNYSSGMLH